MLSSVGYLELQKLHLVRGKCISRLLSEKIVFFAPGDLAVFPKFGHKYGESHKSKPNPSPNCYVFYLLARQGFVLCT